jgi:capsular exopolysaccharide synthesis family protein
MPQQLTPFWNAFKRWWWLIVISAGLAGFSAYYFSSRQPETYQATVTLRVGANLERPDINILQYGGSIARSYEKFVRIRPITQAVVEKLGLPLTPEQLAGQIQTNVIDQAQILEITVFAGSPEVAVDLANAVGEELIWQTTPVTDQAVDYTFIQSELDTTRAQIDEVDRQIRELRDQMLTMTSAADLAEAQNRLAGYEKTKQEFRSYFIQLADLISSRSSSALSIIVPAIPNPSPLGPNPRRDAVFGVVGGILLAIGAIVLLEFSDNALRWSDVTLENSLPVLGIIPAIGRRRNPLIIKSQPNSAEADAIRSLRTRIFLADTGAMIKRLLITSPTPRDGKSFTVVNLALAAADAGLRVIIVDGDIRAGSIHDYFGLEREPGLTNLLWQGKADQPQFLSLLRRTSTKNLQVLTAGTYARDPLMLLRTPRLKQLMDELSERADLILIDSPPVAAGPITTMLSTAADGIVIVASIDRTRRKLFESSRDDLIKNAEAPLLGLALNRIAMNKLSPDLGMYGYGYNYDHSLTKPPGSLLDRLRRLPAAVIQKITRRPLLSSNGQHSSGGMAQWLEETPGDWASSEFTEPKQQPETADDQPAARPSVDSSIMTVAEAAIQLEESEEVIEEWCRSGLLPAVRIGKRWLVTGLTVEGSPPATEPDTEQTSDQVEPLRNM